MVVSTFEIPV